MEKTGYINNIRKECIKKKKLLRRKKISTVVAIIMAIVLLLTFVLKNEIVGTISPWIIFVVIILMLTALYSADAGTEIAVWRQNYQIMFSILKYIYFLASEPVILKHTICRGENNSLNITVLIVYLSESKSSDELTKMIENEVDNVLQEVSAITRLKVTIW